MDDPSEAMVAAFSLVTVICLPSMWPLPQSLEGKSSAIREDAMP